MTAWPFEPLVRGTYSVLYADPPWRWKAWGAKGEGRSASNHYDLMELGDIMELPVAKLGAPDCALFLWVTQPMLPEALALISAWGFRFKTVAYYWVKLKKNAKAPYVQSDVRNGLGYHTRAGAEQCWLATRGAGYERLSKSEAQVIFAPLRQHSRKPDEIAESIVRLCGDVPRAELFARTARPGWESWGNQVARFP